MSNDVQGVEVVKENLEGGCNFKSVIAKLKISIVVTFYLYELSLEYCPYIT